MDTSSKTSAVIAKIILLLFVLMMVAIFLMKPSLNSSVSRAAQGERVFENAIPENAPFRLKIKKEKEKSFKDLKDETWVREFELEFTNISDKPIFFVYINLITDVKIDDSHLIFALVYGRPELGDIITKAGPDDPSIKPGETYVFKIHPGQVPAWEMSLRDKSHPDATRIKAHIQMLSFGDGTGYFVNKPYPRSDKRQSKRNDQMRPPDKGAEILGWPSGEQSTQPKTPRINETPVTLLPAFLLDRNSLTISSSEGGDEPNVNCGLFDNCVGISPYSAVVCYNCPPQNRPGFDSAGDCVELTSERLDCFIDGEKYFCQQINILPCGLGPGPTPPPTSTPTPAPCLYCADPNAIGPADCSNPAQPVCPFYQIQRFGCCYPVTCPSPTPPPPSCPPDYMPGFYMGYPFCDYLPPCVLIPTPFPTPPPSMCPFGQTYNPDAGMCCPNSPEPVDCGFPMPISGCPYEHVANCGNTPIIIDVAGNGFQLTSAANGVDFDFDGNSDHVKEQLSWTAPDSEDAFLVLDRNRNGIVDSGRELFGNLTPQPGHPHQNGFLALAEYDKSAQGGNGDGLITQTDAVFAGLRLWQDMNHNGISEANELHRLAEFGVQTLELNYKESKRTDQFGNEFRYRGKVKDTHGSQLGRWAWDVFLVSGP